MGGHKLAAMRAMVVYESVFGNTRQVAEAIGDGLRSSFDEVEIREVGSAERHIDRIDLLVVGGPIHAWRMTREFTRKAAREQASGSAVLSNGIGIRDTGTESRHDESPVNSRCRAATYRLAFALQ